MAKTKAPLLSFGASGKIGDSMVFGNWKGVPYARRHVVPANPNTTAQQATRDVFRSMDQQYKLMLTLASAVWDEAAKGRPLTGRNRLMSENIPSLREASDMANYTGSPGVRGGLPLDSATPSTGAGSGESDIAWNTPKTPTGWTLEGIIFTAIPDRDPAVEPTEFMTEAEDTTASADSSGTHTLTVPQSDTAYIVSAWPRWSRADGQTAYGPSIDAIASSAA